MKKKILTTVIVTVIFALAIVTSFFVVFSNNVEYNRIKHSLNDYCDILIDSDEGIVNEKLLNDFKINGVLVRCTYISKDGKVIFDNKAETNENHSTRPEVIKAKKKGEGYDVRVSKTVHQKLVYYARLLNDGSILRIAIPYKTTNIITASNIQYWMLVMTIIIVFTVTISMRIVKTIINPLKELEEGTDKIAHGDLCSRVEITTNDEIGLLGLTFNNMADQLQSKVYEVIDKQNRLESILSSMQSGVIAVSMDDEIITINPYAKRALGIRQYTPGDKISDYIKDYDINSFLNEPYDLEREIKVLYPIEKELRIKKAYLVNGEQNIGKVISIHDITEVKRLENMRSQFVANVSHELKTPLTSIKGFAETLKYVEDKDTREKFLDIIDKEAERLTRLINDILVLSKLESTAITEVEEFLPAPIIDDVMHTVESIAVTKKIKLITENSCNSTIELNKDKFHQLVLNLVENAVKYSNEGGEVIVRSYINKNKFHLEVEDNGIGIPKEDIPRIFERFYRVDKARKGGSTGLGLAIVKHIVKTYNGEILVESELEKGSKFIIKLNT